MKKLSATIICFLMILTCCLTGCASFEVNKVKYYNEVVAKVGNTTISRHELLTAYENYGKSYFEEQDGQTKKEALASTLDLLMDREHLYQYAISQGDKYAPTPYQINEIVRSMFESLNSQMDGYATQAKRQLNIDVNNSSSSESGSEKDKEETPYLYSNYAIAERKRAVLVEKTIYYVDENKTIRSENNAPTSYSSKVEVIDYVIEEPLTFEHVLEQPYLEDFNSSDTLDEIIYQFFYQYKDTLKDEDKQLEIMDKARSLFADDLIDYEFYLRDSNGKPYNTVTSDLIYRYFQRTYESQIKSQYLTNIRTYYLENQELSISALEAKYKYLANVSYNSYSNFQTSYKTKMKDIGTDGDTVFYHPQNLDDNTKFGYFAHTLLSFDDTQKVDLKALEKNKQLGMDETEYTTQYNAIISRTAVKPRNASTGLIDEDATAVSLSQIMAEYAEIVSEQDNDKKLEDFIQFMFEYTGDTATLNPGMPYVVGTNGNSAMEAAFTDEAVRLIEEGVVAGMTPADISKVCVTSYGIHLLYYIGDVSCQDIAYGNTDSVYVSLENKVGNSNNLYYLEVNPLTHETYFDLLFDIVYPAESQESTYTSNNGYSEEEERLISINQQLNGYTIYQTKLDGTNVKL